MRNKITSRIFVFFLELLIVFLFSCKKIVQIDPPTASITTDQTFADSLDAASAIAGIYTKMMNSGGTAIFGNGAVTVYCGQSADELLPFISSGDQISTNTLLSSNAIIDDRFWAIAYKYIYQINACIEGVSSSYGLSQTQKNELIGEAKFLWAFNYFYLVNLFGDVPLITSSNYTINSLKGRSPEKEVYDSIVSYLNDAKRLLPIDYSYSNGERIRANALAADALLARVYLYLDDFSNAEVESTSIISKTDLFSLNTDLDQVFLANNTEAILQWNQNTTYSPFNATTEGMTFIPYNRTSSPNYFISNQLLSGLETGDQRRVAWIDSTIYSGTVYYYPYKYKIGPAQRQPGSTPTEYYMVLRLAEQYLIRAEAEANGAGGGLNAAIADLDIIRARARLPQYNGGVDMTSVLTAIYKERKIELFAEWGNRWLDLKRTGHASAALKPVKLLWQSYQQLYPIPISEIRFDPNLTQNPGY